MNESPADYKMPKSNTPPAGAKPRQPEEIRAAVRRGGLSVAKVVFTRNRRVMASVTDGGSTLRLHESFAAAPTEVLHAVGRLFSVRTDSGRRVARQVVNEFLASRISSPTPPRRLPREELPGDRPHLDWLRAEFDRVNREFFGSTLPAVPLWLSGRMRSRNGHFRAQPLEIVISRRLCVEGAAGEAEHTLRHEMIHLWQHRVGTQPDHGGAFRWWARRLDVHPRARRPVRWLPGEAS